GAGAAALPRPNRWEESRGKPAFLARPYISPASTIGHGRQRVKHGKALAFLRQRWLQHGPISDQVEDGGGDKNKDLLPATGTKLAKRMIAFSHPVSCSERSIPMLRVFSCALTVLTISVASVSAAEARKDKSNTDNKKAKQATITKVDAKNGTITVRMKNDQG